VDRHIVAPAIPAEFAERLRHHLEERGDRYRWVQLGDETAVRAVAERYREAWAARLLPVGTTHDLVSLITDKVEFLSRAVDHGIPVPSQRRFESVGDLRRSAKDLAYPLMLKLPESMAGSGVRLARSAEDLDLQASELENMTLPVIVQAYLTGDHGSSEVLFEHGRPIAWINGIHTEFWPNPLAASCVRELIELPEAEDLLRKLGAMTGYHGLAGVDWIRDEAAGRLCFIELNPRPAPCYHLGPRAGVDFARAFRELLAGGPVTVQRPRQPDPKRALVYQFPQYCYRAIGDRAWLRLIRALPDAPWDDPWLVAALVRRVLTHFLPASLRALLRQLAGRPRG
jgi:biotin carboxylase